MKTRLRPLVMLFGLSVFSASVAITDQSTRWLEEQIEVGHLYSAVVVVIDDQSVAHFSFGRTFDEGAAPTRDTQYEIGSITKVFTNLLLAELAAKDVATYATTLKELLPDMDFVNSAVGDITLLELATHTSGLPRMPDNINPADLSDPYADYHREQLLTAIRGVRAGQTLVKAYSYSNFGVGLLGYLLGEVDGSDYLQALRKHVLDPLRMNHTSEKDLPTLAPGHAGGLQTSNWHFEALASAGVLRSNAADMQRLFLPWMSDVDHSLVHDVEKDLEVVATVDADTALTRVWHVRGAGRNRIYWHNGGTGGYRSFAGFNPSTKEGRIVLVNGDLDVTEFGFGLFSSTIAAEVAAESPSKYADYLGHFAITPEFVLSISEQDGRLYVQATGQSPLQIARSEAVDEFNLLAVDARLVFSRDAQGTVNHVVLHQNNQAMPAERVDGPLGVSTFSEVELDEKQLLEYVGRYRLAVGMEFRVMVDNGTLMVQLANQPRLPVYASELDRFFYKVVNAQLSFSREDGEIVSLTLHQNGLDQVALKQ